MSLRPVAERRNSFKITKAELNIQGINLKKPPLAKLWNMDAKGD